MSITANDMQAFLSAEVSDTDPAANGGPPADAPMPLASKNNAYPDVNSRQRERGVRRWRKIFLANLNSADLVGEAVMVLMDAPTAYGDYAYFLPAGFEDHESDITVTGYGAPYGTALLRIDADAGSNALQITLEHESLFDMLAAGREIVVSTRQSFENQSSTIGVEEIHTIQSAVITHQGVMGDAEATVTTSAPLEHDFKVADNARISTVYRPPDQRASVTEWTAGGDPPVSVGNRGTIFETWTLRFVGESASTPPTSFDLSGARLGSLGSFAVDAECAPVNPAAWAAGAPYFTIQANAFASLEYASGRAVSFVTTPAMTPIWVNNVIPAGTREYGLTEVPIMWQVESPA